MSILRINQNIIALNANRALRVISSDIAKSLERLSSGLRINRAADDAAGLSISENLRAQIRGLNRASQNALDGISLIQTAEGALSETSAILQRIRELAVQAANGSLTSNDRISIQSEVDQMINEIDRIAETTEFNTRKLLDGTLGALISSDDPTQVRAAVIGNVGKGGNFTLQLNTIDAGQLQVQKTNVFATIQSEDAVGMVNYLDTITLDATFAPASSQGYGNTGIIQISPTPDTGGETAVANGPATLQIVSLVDAGTSAVSVNNLIQAYEITEGVDSVTFSFVDQAGTAHAVTTMITTGQTLAGLMTSIALAATAASPGTVTFTARADGSFSISGGGINIGSPTKLEFNDVDGSGSKLLLSIHGGLTNMFHSLAVGTIQNLGGTVAFSINGGSVQQIGNAATTGTFDVRFDYIGTRDVVSVAFTPPAGSSLGGTGLVNDVIAFANAAGSIASDNSPLRFELTDMVSVVGGNVVGTTINANGVTSQDSLTLSLTATGAASAHTITILMDPTETMTALAGRISVALQNDAVLLSVNGGAFVAGDFVVSITTAGTLYIEDTAGVDVVSQFHAIRFSDADNSGSEFHVSAAVATGVSLATNVFYSAAAYTVTNAAGTLYAGAVQGGGRLYSIGDANAGGFFGRLDVTTTSLAGSSNVGTVDNMIFNRLSVRAQTDAIAVAYNTDGNQFQEFQNVRQVSNPNSNGTIYLSAITNRTYALFTFNNQAYTSISSAGGTRQAAITAAIMNGRIADGSGNNVFSVGATVNYSGSLIPALQGIEISFDGFLTSGETATFNTSTNNVLTADQQNTLASINRFQDFGVFQGRSNLQFTVYVKGYGSATVNITSNDTLEDLAGKVSLAIFDADRSSDLNIETSIDFFQPPDIVHVNTVGLAKGTLSITTPIPGLNLVFSGDESFLNAMSLIEVQISEAPIYSVAAYNVETGNLIATQKINAGRVQGLLGGLEIYLDTSGGMKLDPDPPVNNTNLTTSNSPYMLANERPELSLAATAKRLFLHVAPRDFVLQIGANQGQTISSYISDLRSEALGVKGLLVVDSEYAEESITIVDQAIRRVSSERGRLGSIQNRLEITIRNLDVAAENLVSSESRIRDVDVAAETLNSTRNQIKLQAAIAALAQANQLPQAVLQLLR